MDVIIEATLATLIAAALIGLVAMRLGDPKGFQFFQRRLALPMLILLLLSISFLLGVLAATLTLPADLPNRTLVIDGVFEKFHWVEVIIFCAAAVGAITWLIEHVVPWFLPPRD